MVLEPRAGAARSERDLLPIEAPSQYFLLCPARSFWKPATCLIRPCPWGRGHAGGSQGPHQNKLGVCSRKGREAQGRIPFTSLPLLPVPVAVYLLCDQGHSAFRRYQIPELDSGSHLDKDTWEGWKLTCLQCPLEGGACPSHSSPLMVLDIKSPILCTQTA